MTIPVYDTTVVGQNADPNWMTWALQALYITIRNHPTFTTDDVWRQLEAWKPESDTHEHRAMGAIMRQGKARDWCSPTSQYQPSLRASRHGAPIRIWRRSFRFFNYDPPTSE